MENHQVIKDAINAVVSIIDKADNEVLISTGHLDSRCYDSPDIIESIHRAKKRNVKFFVLSGQIDKDTTKAVELLRSDIYLLEREPTVHFTLADGKHFRLENRFSKIEGIYKNEIRFNDPLNGNFLRDKFFDALSRASKYIDLLAGACN
jgi:hypothetical protein